MLAEERSVVSDCPYLAVNLDDPIGTPEQWLNSIDSASILGSGFDTALTTVVIGFSDQSLEAVSEPLRSLLQRMDIIADASLPELLLDKALNNIRSKPLASTALVTLLRQSDQTSVENGLFMESLTYSTLQHGQDFMRWLTTRDATKAAEVSNGPVVTVQREDNQLILTLNRPHKHNAFSAAMRDDLCEALVFAHADKSIEQVILRGAGPSFSAGGDLQEFGHARDATLAHLTRITRSPARLIHDLSNRTTVYLQGACIGAGIEMSAFAHRVVAAQDAYFALPEVGFGLVPGAGGTVSIPRRIGRHRTTAMALSGASIDTTLALKWGLIDEVGQS